MGALIVAEGCAIALLGFLVVGLLRSHAEILRALHELGASLDPRPAQGRPASTVPIQVRPPGAGATAYDITGASLDDEVTALAIVGDRQPTLLAFLTSGCATCLTFWTAFAGRDLAVPGGAQLVIVAKDAAEESVSRLREVAPPEATVMLSSAAWADYRVPASPYFVYVDGAAGRVTGEGTAAGWPQVADLLRQALRDAGSRSGRSDRAEAGEPERADRMDAELLAAGIGPGHPSLSAMAPPDPSVDPGGQR